MYGFAGKVAADAAAVDQDDVDSLRAAGLADAEVADVVFAAAARCFFTAVLDGLGTQLDAQTAQSFAPALLESMVVGARRGGRDRWPSAQGPTGQPDEALREAGPPERERPSPRGWRGATTSWSTSSGSLQA